jgi:concentrative nucleoside transporter, CNT family
MPQLISLLGLVVFLALAWLLSTNRRRFPWRTVIMGIALQFVCAIIVLWTPIGRGIFEAVRFGVLQLGYCSDQGAQLVFGPLAKSDALKGVFGPGNAFVFAVSISATIIVVSAISAVLYHWGVLQRVVQAMAWVMQRLMRTSGSESLAAASNIFLGQTEAALVVKPYIFHMTRSELMALMTAGMATIATGVMVVYGGEGIGMDAGHVLTASVLSAPAALLMAKIMVPEAETSETEAGARMVVEKTDANTIDALCRGTSEGVTMAINVMAMLIAFTAIVALLNVVFGGVQWLIAGRPEGFQALTLQNVMGYVNAPFAWLMGVPWEDCRQVGEALGQRIVLNEFVGYLSLAENRATLEPRSLTVATYALCGFANIASIGIQIGGIGALAPARRGDLARLGLRAMVAGLLACYLTATVVGVLIK